MREIGSDFYRLSDAPKMAPPSSLPLSRLEAQISDGRYLSTGRQAIRFCLQDMDLTHKHALLPDYTCQSVIQPFLEEGFQLSFFPLKRDLTLSLGELGQLCRDRQVDLVLFHAYFGFDTIKGEGALPPGVRSIYDDTQSIFSPFAKPQADYRIASIRKWGSFPDGAFCGKREGAFKEDRVLEEDAELLALMEEAQAQKALYIEEGQGDKARFRESFLQASALLASRQDFYRMGDDSFRLFHAFDYEAMKESRRANYQALLSYPGWQALGQPLFPKLEDQVPLYFPFYVRGGDRDRLQAFLAKRDIYAPVIWPLAPYLEAQGIQETSRWIYQHILALPIDQRYDRDDMGRILGVLDDYSRAFGPGGEGLSD